MASRESIAIRNESALASLNASAEALSRRFKIEPPSIPTDYVDPRELPVMQLEVIAAWADELLAHTASRERTPAGSGAKEQAHATEPV